MYLCMNYSLVYKGISTYDYIIQQRTRNEQNNNNNNNNNSSNNCLVS